MWLEKARLVHASLDSAVADGMEGSTRGRPVKLPFDSGVKFKLMRACRLPSSSAVEIKFQVGLQSISTSKKFCSRQRGTNKDCAAGCCCSSLELRTRVSSRCVHKLSSHACLTLLLLRYIHNPHADGLRYWGPTSN